MSSAAGVIGALRVKVPETKIAEFANSVDLDEVALNSQYDICTCSLDLTCFEKL